MCIKKAVAKLAAAAVLVAGGVVGTAWAQTSPVTDALGGECNDGADCSGKMYVRYNVDYQAEIEIGGKADISREDFETFDITATKTMGPEVGNLGWVRVKTNSTAWDVVLTTKNGGRLSKDQYTPNPSTQHWDMGCMCMVDDPADSTLAGSVYLKYNTMSGPASGTQAAEDGKITYDDATNDEVQLMVKIGMIEPYNGSFFPKGSTTSGQVAQPTKITATSLLGSGGSSPTAISLAALLGGDAATNSFAQKTFGTSATQLKVGNRTIEDAETSGFDATGANSEYFYVDVGLNQSLMDKLAGNEKGEYTEEFIFTLTAQY